MDIYRIINNNILELIFLTSFFILTLLYFWKVKWRNFLLTISSILFSLLLGEAICRLYDYGNPHSYTYREKISAKPELGYHYEPNQELIYYYPDNPRGYFDSENRVVGHINSKGFRGAEKDFKKDDTVTRIAVLGDSYTLGLGNKDEDTLCTRMEYWLKSLGKNVEVLNFGVTSTNTALQVNLLQRYVLRFEPDIVLLIVCMNDVESLPKPCIKPEDLFSLSKMKTFRSTRRFSWFVNTFLKSIERHLISKRMTEIYITGYEDKNPGWISIKESILKARNLALENHFIFRVCIYPEMLNLDKNYPFRGIHFKIWEFCQNNNIKVFDLLNLFIGKKDSELYHFLIDKLQMTCYNF